jgi:F0F1-type ATP synthase membrane subunit b/b'
MNLQIEWWHLAGLVVSLIGAFWALISLMVSQFNKGLDKRFEGIDKRFEVSEKARTEANQTNKERFDRVEDAQRVMERELLSLKAELPEKYVRREDAIRSEMTLHAKFDGLASRIDQFMRATNG